MFFDNLMRKCFIKIFKLLLISLLSEGNIRNREGGTEEDYDDFMASVTAVLKVGLESVPLEVSEKCIHIIPFTVCFSGPRYHGNIENTVYSCTH